MTFTAGSVTPEDRPDATPRQFYPCRSASGRRITAIAVATREGVCEHQRTTKQPTLLPESDVSCRAYHPEFRTFGGPTPDEPSGNAVRGDYAAPWFILDAFAWRKMKKFHAWALTIFTVLAVSIGFSTSPAMAVTWEVDKAVKSSSSPNTGGMLCKGMSGRGGEVCYESAGDYWWVFDQTADGKSVAVEWRDYVDYDDSATIYRAGVCVNSNGAPSWASCNKNYYESHGLEFRMCLYDNGARWDCGFWSSEVTP
ncbi:hypothetical protein [Streptomyces anthocyanicus]|uniref:hypothetical protein n=1 Tax=Streptomyces anthocyanicus TaxID=68174 RepID=UPI002F90DB7F|nr:hypothetical protein OH747_40515 [Streptomyces anthocyanicus]